MNLLFMCVANSARSQIAEGLAWVMASEMYPDTRVYSAGSAPSEVRLQAIEVMREIGVDISAQWSKGVEAVPLEVIDVLITLCAEEVCPVIPTIRHCLHWPIPDPAGHDEPYADQLERFRSAREEIQHRLDMFFTDPHLV